MCTVSTRFNVLANDSTCTQSVGDYAGQALVWTVAHIVNDSHVSRFHLFPVHDDQEVPT